MPIYIKLVVEPIVGEHMDHQLLKELIENNGCSLPWQGQQIFHGDQPIADVKYAFISEGDFE